MKNCAIFLFTFILIGSAQPIISSNMCTSMSYIGDLLHGKHLEETSFYTISDIGLIGCAKECLLRIRCQSFNYNINTTECGLNYHNLKNNDNGTINNSSSINRNGTLGYTMDKTITINNSSEESVQNVVDDQHIFSYIGTWPGRIAGLCSDHSCPENSFCQELENGRKTCQVECHDPPSLQNGEILTLPVQHDVGFQLNYSCDHGYRKYGKAICKASGLWAQFVCTGPCYKTPSIRNGEIVTNGRPGPWPARTIFEVRCKPGFFRRYKTVRCKGNDKWNNSQFCYRFQNCSDVKKCNPNYTDGDYWIFPQQTAYRKIRIYCHNMTSIYPNEFISLPNFINHTVTDCKPFSLLDSRTCKSTIADKLQIDIVQMTPIPNILHNFAGASNSSCEPINIGDLRCCTHEIHVDMSGTGLVFESSESWDFISEDRRVTVLHGRCSCEQCESYYRHFKNMTLSLDDDKNSAPDNNLATMPMCNT